MDMLLLVLGLDVDLSLHAGMVAPLGRVDPYSQSLERLVKLV